MARILLLTEPELRRLVPLDAQAVACVEAAFAALAAGAMPPILRLSPSIAARSTRPPMCRGSTASSSR